jgi:hypothetical protein
VEPAGVAATCALPLPCVRGRQHTAAALIRRHTDEQMRLEARDVLQCCWQITSFTLCYRQQPVVHQWMGGTQGLPAQSLAKHDECLQTAGNTATARFV